MDLQIRGPRGHYSQIDHIIINKKWKNSVVNSEAYSTFSSVGSDHRVVVAEIKLSLRRPQIAARKVKHDWNCLRAGTHGEISFDSVDSRSSSVYVNMNYSHEHTLNS